MAPIRMLAEAQRGPGDSMRMRAHQGVPSVIFWAPPSGRQSRAPPYVCVTQDVENNTEVWGSEKVIPLQ